MNAGFSNLTTLKAQLLAKSLRERDDWDTQIRALGLGVAAQFSTHCNRQFARLAGDFYVTSGGRMSVIVPRYPVEGVAAIETRDGAGDDWSDQQAQLDYYDQTSGIVRFESVLGAGGQIRVTYTGGYVWETKEPADEGFPTIHPAGAAPIPEDLLTAWLLQCEAVWGQRDKLGTKIADKASGEGALAAFPELIPAVRLMLNGHIRYALT